MPPAALKRCKHLRKDNQNPSPEKGGGFFIGNGSGQPRLNRNDHPFIYIACRAIAALIRKFSHNRFFTGTLFGVGAANACSSVFLNFVNAERCIESEVIM